MRIVIILCLLLLFPLLGQAKELHVGVIIPLSGPAAHVGRAIQNGMSLALEDRGGKESSALKVHFEDDGMLPKNALSAMRKLLHTHEIDVFVNTSSQTGKVVAPLAEQKQIPLISISRDEEVVAGKEFVMSFWVPVPMEVQLTLNEMRRQGVKKIARISTLHEGSLSFKRVFDEQNSGAIAIALEEEFPVEHTDFRTVITKIRGRENIDAVFALLQPGQIGLFAKQLRDQGVALPLFGNSVYEDRKEVQAAEGALEGAWFVGAKTATSAFRERYRARYPEATEFLAAHGHDIIKMLGDIAPRVQGAKALNRELHQVKDFPGALGVFSARPDNRFSLPMTLKTIRGQSFLEQQEARR